MFRDFRKYLNYSTEDFIKDQEFLDWINHQNTEIRISWNKLLEKYPELKNKIEDAKLIIKSLQPEEHIVSDETLNKIFNKIVESKKTTGKRDVFNILKIAAFVVVLLFIGSLTYWSLRNKIQSKSELIISESQQKGRIILYDGTIYEFDTDETRIKHTTTGDLLINQDSLGHSISKSKKNELFMNHIIIPFGKRTNIILADGTKIWLNSGSQLSYPNEFNDNVRKVNLVGEAFFDIKPDESKPFFVITQELKIKVSGTRFNVSAYSEDSLAQTVLLEGNISIERNKLFSNKIELIPGEMSIFNKQDASLRKENVNVELYTSWIDGYLLFNNELTTSVLKKLERFYNRCIMADHQINYNTFSGKLDLKEDLNEVLNTISFASSLKIIEDDTCIILKP